MSENLAKYIALAAAGTAAVYFLYSLFGRRYYIQYPGESVSITQPGGPGAGNIVLDVGVVSPQPNSVVDGNLPHDIKIFLINRYNLPIRVEVSGEVSAVADVFGDKIQLPTWQLGTQVVDLNPGQKKEVGWTIPGIPIGWILVLPILPILARLISIKATAKVVIKSESDIVLGELVWDYNIVYKILSIY